MPYWREQGAKWLMTQPSKTSCLLRWCVTLLSPSDTSLPRLHILLCTSSVLTMVIISSFSELCCLRHGVVVHADCAAIYRPPVAVHGQQHGYETMQAAVQNADSCSKMTHAQTCLMLTNTTLPQTPCCETPCLLISEAT